MAAVGAMPDLEAEGHDGKVGQETPSSIPLLGEEEEGKKGEKEEEKEGEEEEKAEKEEERKGEEEENAGKKKRKKKGKNIVNMEIAFTPPMNGTRKDIWICGDHVISLSTRRSQYSQLGMRLCFPAYVAAVIWRGIPTMMWNDLLPNLHQLYHQCRLPSIVIIHLGENDLLVDSSHSLVTKMQNDLVILQEAFQGVAIIWSALLPKSLWRPYEKSQVLEFERSNVNCKMEEFCNENGMYYFSHPSITCENRQLFTPEGTLSNKGADVFIMELKKVLHTYLDHN